ncbi:hypothetical protein [Streptomyces malaysiensis]|uniref:hypothetical protein n=1 Tax=Streptomyces malaysiensis TaxID=92644 RepID=UPI002B2B0735|nr:hypothetical protein R8789_12800 [Streptomyces malaysiensis]
MYFGIRIFGIFGIFGIRMTMPWAPPARPGWSAPVPPEPMCAGYVPGAAARGAVRGMARAIWRAIRSATPASAISKTPRPPVRKNVSDKAIYLDRVMVGFWPCGTTGGLG